MSLEISINGKKARSISEWLKSKIYTNYKMRVTEDDVTEVVEESTDIALEQKIAEIKNLLNKKVVNIIDDNFLNEVIKESDIKSIIKTNFGNRITSIIRRDTNEIVDRALEDLENEYIITKKIRTYVRNKILRVFE